MKKAYPIVLTPDTNGYVVYVPDLDINTEGEDLVDAMAMARDAIGLWGICEQDAGRDIPEPSITVPEHAPEDITTFVDIDFDAYRRAHENRTVRRNVTLPSWLNDLADKSNINVSGVLQDALKARLHVDRP